MTQPPANFVEWWHAQTGQRDPLQVAIAWQAIQAFSNECNAIVEAQHIIGISITHGHAIVRMFASWHRANVEAPEAVNKPVNLVNNPPVNAEDLRTTFNNIQLLPVVGSGELRA